MSGIITPLGEVTVGGCLPTSVAAFASVEGNIEGQLAAAGAMQIALNLGPPSVSLAAQMAATVSGQIAASVTAPYFGLQIDANLTLIAALNAQLAALAGILTALGTAGVYLYRYNGTADSFGTELQATIGGGIPGGSPTDHVDALVLLASTPAAWAAIQTVMKTT